MDAKSACQLIDQIVYKPDWKLQAEVDGRFENSVRLNVEYKAPNFTKENAPDYRETTRGYASFVIPCAFGCDEYAIYRQVLQRLLEIEHHEAREAFRVAPTMDAPFHPHRQAGMERWGSPQADLTFGV